MTLYIAALPPMPSASEPMAMAVKPRSRAKFLAPKRISRKACSSQLNIMPTPLLDRRRTLELVYRLPSGIWPKRRHVRTANTPIAS